MKEIVFYIDPTIPAESDWRQRANCRAVSDPDVFFPIGSSGPALDQIEAAKAICSACAVRTDCLTWALETNQETGVWGGLAEEERKGLTKLGREPAYA